MFRSTPSAAAPITAPTTDAFSVVDVRTAAATGAGLRIAAEAAVAGRLAGSPAESVRPRPRHEARVAAPRSAHIGRRTATSSGYRPR